jgi:hypothetical protein
MTIRAKVYEATAEDSLATRKMLALTPPHRNLASHMLRSPKMTGKLAILSRSVLEIIIDLASYIEVPAIHVEGKRVNPTQTDGSDMGGPATPMIRLHCSR